MTHDFNKPPHVISAEEKTHKKRVPVYILILIGIFFIALLAYMFADRAPSATDTAPNPATPNNTTTGSDKDSAKGY
ncbi:hypothetical protein D9M71_26300 [compost metagenome]